MFVQGFHARRAFVHEIADFSSGKPGPGSISEALAKRLPVIVQRNVDMGITYNADWVWRRWAWSWWWDFATELAGAVRTCSLPRTAGATARARRRCPTPRPTKSRTCWRGSSLAAASERCRAEANTLTALDFPVDENTPAAARKRASTHEVHQDSQRTERQSHPAIACTMSSLNGTGCRWTPRRAIRGCARPVSQTDQQGQLERRGELIRQLKRGAFNRSNRAASKHMTVDNHTREMCPVRSPPRRGR